MDKKGACVMLFIASCSVMSVYLMPLNENNNDEEIPDLSYLGNRVFRQPSPETGKILENWNATSDANPEELGEYAEGDILFPRRGKNGLIAESARWPNGVIPYSIDGYFNIDSLNMINRAMSLYHKYTCLKFRKRTSTDTDYISIVNTNTGCWSSVGRIGGKQDVNLQSPSCTYKVGTPIHELMHAAGFLHEQNRFERDDFVTIAWSNIRKGHENNFDKADATKTIGFGIPYDYRSVMHYSSTAFSVNGQKTIIPKDGSKVAKMGQRDGFSKGDLTKINKMYKCPEKTAEIIANGSFTATPSGGNKENSNPLVEATKDILGLLFHKK
ncbi:hatching enzyme 1.2-like [Euwallacea fornicatus]|uniref:hatching enzyme 1.2-like n=1 Tax=Euwallacea fornicatus TaxID=995702 RepID=UPI00338E6C94